MPEICVYAVAGRSPEQKAGLCRDITDAVVRNFGVAPDVVVVQIVEVAAESKSRGGVMFSAPKG